MRIIGYIEHPSLKITVFKMDNKISVKFETGLYEQTYKLRMDNHIDGLAAVQKLVDTKMIEEVLELFTKMHTMKNQAIERFVPIEEEEEFEEII
jgi:hypothetical protein